MPGPSNVRHTFGWIVLSVTLVGFAIAWFALPHNGAAAGHAEARVGAAAPSVTLPLLGGGTFNLADQKGSVVVMDFWASWCGPCVEALPTVVQLLSEYESKNVKFVAVNLEESPDVINAFLKDKNYAPAVAMTADTDVAQRYGVEYIPFTVVVDRGGVIRHMGNIPPENLKELLPQWIETAKDQ